jgi:hypothetical protein
VQSGPTSEILIVESNAQTVVAETEPKLNLMNENKNAQYAAVVHCLDVMIVM